MIKNVTQFKCVINDVECIFHFDASCPTNIAKDALFACLKWIGQIEDGAKSQEQAKKSEEQPPVESFPEQITEVVNE